MSRRMPLWPESRDTVPQGEEQAGDTAWHQFHAIADRLDAQFAPTQPLEAVPAGATLPPPDAATDLASVDGLMALARRYNRVCPLPAAWRRLAALLPPRPGRPVPAPVAEASWHRTSALDKRLVLRAQIEWAALCGQLPAVARFLAGLPEQDWHHVGQ